MYREQLNPADAADWIGRLRSLGYDLDDCDIGPYRIVRLMDVIQGPV